MRIVTVFWSLIVLMLWVLAVSGSWLKWWAITPHVLGVIGIIVVLAFVLEIIVGMKRPRPQR
jgi:hypothetical protein